MVTRGGVAGVLVGVLAGMAVGGGAAVAIGGRDELEGVTVKCTGNGDGGFRRCDAYVDTPGPVYRMDYRLFLDGEEFVRMSVSKINPHRGPLSNHSLDEYLRPRVEVRQ